MREHHEAWQGRAETSCKIAEMRLCTDAFIRDQVFVKEGDCDESIPQQRTRHGYPLPSAKLLFVCALCHDCLGTSAPPVVNSLFAPVIQHAT